MQATQAPPSESCKGKEVFHSKKAAERALVVYLKARHRKGYWHSYDCPHCHGFHYGRLSEARMKKIKQLRMHHV